MIRWGPERARTGPWRGQGEVAYLTPLPDAPAPSAAFVRRCCDELASRGFRRVVTGALAPSETAGFLSAGFEVTERLHLLGHDLRALPLGPSGVALRKAAPEDLLQVLDVDTVSFAPFWRLDRRGLEDAVEATPHSRFRVAEHPEAAGMQLVGYAVTGRAGRRGFIQRLAVHPDAQRHGFGRALALDGLRWLRRWRVERALVNTQLSNDAALALYERVGFRHEPSGLSVLSLGLDR